MRTTTIKNIVNKLARGDFSNVFLQQISERVEYGVVWSKYTTHSIVRGKYEKEHKDYFYFIKNHQNIYVGAVLIMKANGDDLHCFIKKKHRKKGILTSALKESILPHLLGFKNEQRITILYDIDDEDSYYNSKKVAEKVGFKEISEDEYTITRKDIMSTNNNQILKKGITKDRFNQLSAMLFDISLEIEKIEDEFEINLGKLKSLKRLRVSLKKFVEDKLENEYYKLKSTLDD